jgi:hypothetical protein
MNDEQLMALLHSFLAALRDPSRGGAVAAISLCVAHEGADGSYVAQAISGGTPNGLATCIATTHNAFHKDFGACPFSMIEGGTHEGFDKGSASPGTLQ